MKSVSDDLREILRYRLCLDFWIIVCNLGCDEFSIIKGEEGLDVQSSG